MLTACCVCCVVLLCVGCTEYVVTDGRLVTGQNPASAEGVAKQAVAVIEGKQLS